MAAPESRPARAYHDVHLTEHSGRRVVWQVVADYLAPWVARDAHVLELGAGYCDWINAVRAARKVAVDVWPEFGRFARDDVDARVLDAAGGLTALGGAQFDVVLASNLLEHFDASTASSVIADVSALLRPRGRFIVIQPNFRLAYRRYFDDYTHRSVFTDTSLSNLLRSHRFAIELAKPRFLPYSMRGLRTPVPSWLIRTYLRSPIKPMAGQMLIIGQKI